MKITARNYAARVERDIRAILNYLIPRNCINAGLSYCDDCILMARALENIKDAVHFAVPDNGLFFNDFLRGMDGLDMRLPFNKITLSLHAEYPTLIVAQEISSDELKLIWAEFDGAYFSERWIVAMMFNEYAAARSAEQNKWSPGVCGIAIPCANWNISQITKDMRQVRYYEIDFSGTIAAFKRNTSDTYFSERYTDTANAIFRVLAELLEALSCSNVTHEPIEQINPAVNARRIRDGKLPLYETRCLIINAGKQSAAGAAHGGTHASPRQHLRRGHIRRLPSVNIWVNSCVVSANSPLGKIDKSYAVTA